MGFKLEDITGEFLSHVVFYDFTYPTRLNDWSGSITMLTDEGREYFIDGASFEVPESEWRRVFPVLGELEEPVASCDETQSADGKWRGIFAFGGFVAIRSHLADAYRKLAEGREFPWPLGIAAQVLGLDPGEVHGNRVVHDAALVAWANERREQAVREACRTRVRLGPDDVEWTAIPADRHIAYKGDLGCRALLLRRCADGAFDAVVWTIEFQLDTDMSTRGESQVELYNLYLERLGRSEEPAALVDVPGAWPPPWRRGEFVRSFRTLAEAKAGAMRRNGCIGWGCFTKEDLLDNATFEPAFPRPEDEPFDYDLGERPRPLLCGQAADSWLVRMRDADTGEVAELVWDHAALSSVVCECPMDPSVPARAVLLSIDPIRPFAR